MSGADWQYVGNMLEEAKRRSEQFNGPCSSCRHSRRGFERTCRNPIIEAQAITIDRAYSRNRLRECEWQRGVDNMYGPIICGPEGRLHEPSLFARIKAQLRPPTSDVLAGEG